MVAAAPALKSPAFNNAAKGLSQSKSDSISDTVTKVSVASIAVMLLTEFVSNAFLHFSPLGLALSAKFAAFAGWVPTTEAIGANTGLTSGGQAALTFQ